MKYVRYLSVVIALALFGAGAFADVPKPEIPKGKGDKCVEPTSDMRRNHMEYILHQRDETMHRGIRTSRHSFKECISCHVVPGDDGKPVTYKSEKHFCNSCHSYAAVKIDCFDCHASTPTEPEKAAMSAETEAGSLDALSVVRRNYHD